MGRTLKYYPSSGFLPSVVSATFFCKTCNELISCDSGALAAHSKSKTLRAVRMCTIPWGSSFTIHHYHTTLTRNCRAFPIRLFLSSTLLHRSDIILHILSLYVIIYLLNSAFMTCVMQCAAPYPFISVSRGIHSTVTPCFANASCNSID